MTAKGCAECRYVLRRNRNEQAREQSDGQVKAMIGGGKRVVILPSRRASSTFL